jgi:hypothetical protein
MGQASESAAFVTGQAPPKRKMATNRRCSDDFIALWCAPKRYSQRDFAKDANLSVPFKPICCELENGYFVKGAPLTIYRPAPGAMAWQKTTSQQQHQRPSQEQNPCPSRQCPARPTRLAPQQQGADQRGKEQQIEQVLRLIRHLQHDLADMRTAFH